MSLRNPIETLIYIVPEPSDVVRQKLSSATATSHWRAIWPFSRPPKPFHGQVDQTCFCVTKVIYFGNPHHPVGYGGLEPNQDGGTKITVHLQPNRYGFLYDLLTNGMLLLFLTIAVFAGSWNAKGFVIAACVLMYSFQQFLSWLSQQQSVEAYRAGFESLFPSRR